MTEWKPTAGGLIVPNYVKPPEPLKAQEPSVPLPGDGREVLIFQLVPATDEILQTKMEPFDFANPPEDPIQLAYNLVATMRHYKGIGISANQLGLPYRVFAMDGMPAFVCFNPRVVDTSEETVILDEACLSFPHIVVKVKRPKHVRVRFQTPNGETVTKVFTGITARCFQHELQHLDGEFFFKGVGRMKMDAALRHAGRMGASYSSMNLMKHATATN